MGGGIQISVFCWRLFWGARVFGTGQKNGSARWRNRTTRSPRWWFSHEAKFWPLFLGPMIKLLPYGQLQKVELWSIFGNEISEEMNLLLAWAWQQLRFWHHGKEMMCCGENWARNSWMKMKLGFCGRMWHQHIDDCWVAIYGDPRATPWRVTVIVDSWLFNWKWPVGESDDGKINKKRRVTC